MSSIDKNFVVKQGLEVAEDLIFADGQIDNVGINTRNPQYDFQVDGDIALGEAFWVKPDEQLVTNKSGIISQFSPDLITGIDTSGLRINDIVIDSGREFLQSYTRIISINANEIQLSKTHTNTSNDDVVGFDILRDFDSGELGNVLISRGPEKSPIWGKAINDTKFTDEDNLFYPTFSPGVGKTDLYINDQKLVFNPSSARLAIGKNSPNANLDVAGNVEISDTLEVEGFTKINDELEVAGNTKLNSELNVAGDATLESELEVTGNTRLNSELEVQGLSRFRNNVEIDGSTIIRSTLDVSGEGTFEQNVVIKGDANVESDLTVSGETQLDSTLTVEGLTTINDDLEVFGNTTSVNYYGNGDTLVGIVTQIVPSIGINIKSTQEPGKGVVTIDAYNPVGKTIFVHQNGDDNNSGLTENDAKRTIKNAASIALFGDTIRVYPGVYVEDNPIILNPTVSVEGAELRNCVVTPKNPSKDLFQVNNGCHVTSLSFIGQDSREGAAIVAFQPLLGTEVDRYFDAARMIRYNLDFIAAETVGFLTSTDYRDPPFQLESNDYTSCKDDIKDILKAIIFDITRGGNSRSVGAGLSYYSDETLQHITEVKQETIDAIQFAVGIARSCVNNVLWEGNYQTQELQLRDLAMQPDPETGSNIDVNSCANVISAIQTCANIITTIIDQGPSNSGIITTFPGNSGIGFTTLLPIQDASYDEVSGKVTLTIPNYPAVVGDTIEIRNLEFECTSGESPSTQKFPSGRFGYEFYIERINEDDSFDVYVGISTIPHTYVQGSGFAVDRSIKVTDAIYDNTTGITTITAPGAYVRLGDIITVRDLEFSCPSGPAILKYPSGKEGYYFVVDEVNEFGNTFTIRVGTSTLPHTYEGGGLVFPAYSRGVGPITQGPYVRNCTNFVPKSIGMKIDGLTAEPGDKNDIGVTGTMSVDSYTQYNQGGIGVSITNGAYAQLVSIFGICNDIAIYTASGAQCDLTNSCTSFGTFGLVSEGVGDATSKSIYRYTGEVTKQAPQEQGIITVGGIGTYRPYDGQVLYFGELYYRVQRVKVTNGGSGYVVPPTVVFDAPTGPNGIRAEALCSIDENGSVISVDLIGSGTQYQTTPNITFVGGGGSGAEAEVTMYPIYYTIESATKPVAGISTITLNNNLNNTVSVGTTVYFSRLSLQLTSSHAFEWVGAGNSIFGAKPSLGGVTITENEVVRIDGGEVVYTSTDQAGNFRIGDGIVINQLTGTISGRAYTQSVLTTVTPLIVALG